MEKKIQDYLHYYIGCRVKAAPFGGQPHRLEEGKLVGININDIVHVKLDNWQSVADVTISLVKPILRKIGDFTNHEKEEYNSLIGKTTDGVHSIIIHYDTPETFHYLLKLGFDLFDLIDPGLAIDASTLTK